jgi:hypothetical protein
MFKRMRLISSKYVIYDYEIIKKSVGLLWYFVLIYLFSYLLLSLLSCFFSKNMKSFLKQYKIKLLTPSVPLLKRLNYIYNQEHGADQSGLGFHWQIHWNCFSFFISNKVNHWIIYKSLHQQNDDNITYMRRRICRLE